VVSGILLLRFALSPEAEDALTNRIWGLGISIFIKTVNAIILLTELPKCLLTVFGYCATGMAFLHFQLPL
jgi:hypothetical protein